MHVRLKQLHTFLYPKLLIYFLVNNHLQASPLRVISTPSLQCKFCNDGIMTQNSHKSHKILKHKNIT